jgi:hypothetical protein
MPESNRSSRLPILVPVMVFVVFGLIGVVLFAASPHQTILEIRPTRTNQTERCLTCHNGIEPISASHPISEFGCVSCHEGNRLATDAKNAHSGMIRNPAALGVAEKYCGECHAAQTALVPRTIMSTYAGAIALVRRTFGLQTDDKAHYATIPIGDLPAFTVQPTDPIPVQHFSTNCLSCHLNAEPIKADYYHRSTGCSSCHVLYGMKGLYEGSDPAIPKDKAGYPLQHTFTTAIPYTQCNHCHNRGNYDLRSMTFVPRTDLPVHADLSAEAKRAREYYQPIGQFTRCEFELDCIDCHTSQEIMGDGVLHNNRTEAQYVQCSSCHGTLDAPPPQAVVQENDLALRYSRLNPNVDDLQVGATILITQRGEPIWNVHQEGKQWVLTGKATGIRYTVPLVTGSKCQQKPDQQASRYCHECHTYQRTDQP